MTPMRLYLCSLITEEPLFFASKEISNLYVTAPYVGNYALVYALRLAPEEYPGSSEPHYRQDFWTLDTYVFPAKFTEYRYTVESFNATGEGFYLAMRENIVIDGMMRQRLEQKHHQSIENIRIPVFNSPQIGRLKMIAPESRAFFFVLTERPLFLPKFVRLGKFLTKCRIDVTELQFQERTGSFFCPFPLNPVDLDKSYTILSYSMVSLKPVSLIEAVQAEGPYLSFCACIGSTPENFCLPHRVGYFMFYPS